MKIHGLSKTTLLDFPGHLACTVFTGHCNFRCPFCHNMDLITGLNSIDPIPLQDVIKHLNLRKGVIDLVDFIKKIKERDLLVKLDSNGTRPDILKELIDSSLVDYIAMDIKSSKEGYPKACGLKSMDLSVIEESVKLLMNSGIEYEFRTTVMKELHSEKEFREIAEWIKGCSAYYLQSYRPSETLLGHMMDDDFKASFPTVFTPYTNEELKGIRDMLISLGVNTSLRGIA